LIDVLGLGREGQMPTKTLDAELQELLRGRYVAALGTENADGSIHLTAVWYLFEDGALFVATSTKTRKFRNVVIGKGARREETATATATATPKFVRGMEILGSRNLGLKF
jgi:hypothetical protein